MTPPREPSPPSDMAASVMAVWTAPLALLRDEMLALGALMPGHAAEADRDGAREARHAAGIEEAFDDVPV